MAINLSLVARISRWSSGARSHVSLGGFFSEFSKIDHPKEARIGQQPYLPDGGADTAFPVEILEILRHAMRLCRLNVSMLRRFHLSH